MGLPSKPVWLQFLAAGKKNSGRYCEARRSREVLDRSSSKTGDRLDTTLLGAVPRKLRGIHSSSCSTTASSICNLGINKSEDYLLSLPDSALQFVIDADFWPQVIASMIKAAHLTLFKMFGYEHVFSPDGMYVASILRDFFEKYKRPAKPKDADVADYFRHFETMVVPMMKCDDLVGTITDSRLLSVFDNRDRIFAMGVAVNAGSDMFCVFVPGMGAAIDTYFSFLNAQPPSIAVKLTRLSSGTADKESHFEILEGDPGRFFFSTPSGPC